MKDNVSVLPQNYHGDTKKERVRDMFDKIAKRYDLLNHVLSAGTDYRWRKKVIEELKSVYPGHFLDVATGTADLAIAETSLVPESVTGIDISEGMLKVGEEKIRNSQLSGKIRLMVADCQALPFGNDHFDAVTVAFGVRNFENLELGLSEMLRVLKPGGKTVVLEFSSPVSAPVRQLYHIYSRYIMPAIGQLLARERKAYEYLPESIKKFPSGNDFLDIMKKTGFHDVNCRPLTFGIASIYTGYKS